MPSVQRIVGIAIAFLYVYVVNKAISVYYDEEGVNNMNCYLDIEGSEKMPFGRYTYGRRKYDEECGKRRRHLRDSIKNSKFIVLVLAGIAAIAVGFLAKHPEFKASAALGGLLSILWATFLNWDNFKDYTRLMLAGGSLVVLSVMLLRN